MKQWLCIAGALCSGLNLGWGQTQEMDVVASRIPREETGFERDHLTGDWRGWRSRLVDHGIHLNAGYTGEALGNIKGGLKRGAIYAGLLELSLDVDSEKVGLWKGGSFRASSLFPHGDGLTREHTGDLLVLSNIDAFDSFRLFELWYEQRFSAFSLRLGQLAADEEFAFSTAGGVFLNSGFGWAPFISGNIVNGGPSYYVAAPAVRARVESGSAYFQAGIYDGDPFDSPDGDPRVNASGTRVHLSSSQGYLLLNEAGLKWKQEDKKLPGEFKLGGWFHSADYPSNYRDRSGDSYVVTGSEPHFYRHNYGIYGVVEQMIWREADATDQGLWIFSRFGASPRNRNVFEWVYDGGLNYGGLIPGRDEDQFGIGLIYAKLSRDIRRRERDDRDFNNAAYSDFSDYEMVVECTYSIQVKKWLVIQPDFQWIHHPGGSGAIPDALVTGLRATVIF